MIMIGVPLNETELYPNTGLSIMLIVIAKYYLILNQETVAKGDYPRTTASDSKHLPALTYSIFFS